MKRVCAAAVAAILIFGCLSCGTYEVLGPTADLTEDDVGPGDRIRVRLSEGGLLEDIVVRVTDEAFVCRGRDLLRDEIVRIERWRSQNWKTLAIVAGVGELALLVINAGLQSMRLGPADARR
ncbi:MAG: hypothetical protein JXB46_11375 [Candidatus Eisenbacteria bacterium]|nr:hypothetical protein [Candidatus Eisenbacteria bacterium]